MLISFEDRYIKKCMIGLVLIKKKLTAHKLKNKKS